MINITIVKQKHIDANTIEIYSTLINIIARNMFTKLKKMQVKIEI